MNAGRDSAAIPWVQIVSWAGAAVITAASVAWLVSQEIDAQSRALFSDVRTLSATVGRIEERIGGCKEELARQRAELDRLRDSRK